jgi:probable rRNA maturation factor
VTVSDEWGRPAAQAAAAGLGDWLARVAPPRAGGTVNIALVSDKCAGALNRQYRGRNSATDVLSFPGSDRVRQPGRASHFPEAAQNLSLGEIVIARGVARRQARDARHSYATELRMLALHGLLHLLGYDHENDAGAMATLERRLRTKGGLRAGLLERTTGEDKRRAGDT